MKKKIFLLVFLSCFFLYKYGQDKIEIESIFKMQLYLDPSIYIYSSKNDSLYKNDHFYGDFSKNTVIKFDTLKSNNIDEKFKFFLLKLDIIQFNTTTENLEKSDIEWGVFSGLTSYFILGVNIESKQSYRLFGFKGNDFLNFMSDYREYHNSSNLREYMSDKQFLKECAVEKIDFNCLYKGLHDKNWNRNKYPDKYPCLKRVSDPIITNCYFY